MAMKNSDRVSQVLPPQSAEALEAEQRMRRSFQDCNSVLEALGSWSATEVAIWVDLYGRCRQLTRRQARAFDHYRRVVGD